MDEHTRIAHYFAPLTRGEVGAFGLQNDAASLSPPLGKQLVVTTDSVIAGIHLPIDATAEQLTRKLFRRNISDLAAMGAAPWRYTLNIHVPSSTNDDWWQQCADTLAGEQSRYRTVLVGGDCTSGADAAHLSATFFGLCDTPLLRSGAQVGDSVYVTGTIGDAALYLHTQAPEFAAAYYAPEPPIEFVQHIAKYVSSCIDISDGVLADAQHIAQRSDCAIEMQHASIPLSVAAQHYIPLHWEPLLSGGDDYQLLFTAAAIHRDALNSLANAYGIRLTRVGQVQKGRGVIMRDASGEAMVLKAAGYSHA